MENIIRFLDIGKADFDQINRGIKAQGAAIIDINKTTSIPLNADKRKNKNDFYRFLLDQNAQSASHAKINNDILIPRSILKRVEKPLN